MKKDAVDILGRKLVLGDMVVLYNTSLKVMKFSKENLGIYIGEYNYLAFNSDNELVSITASSVYKLEVLENEYFVQYRKELYDAYSLYSKEKILSHLKEEEDKKNQRKHIKGDFFRYMDGYYIYLGYGSVDIDAYHISQIGHVYFKVDEGIIESAIKNNYNVSIEDLIYSVTNIIYRFNVVKNQLSRLKVYFWTKPLLITGLESDKPYTFKNDIDEIDFVLKLGGK